MAADLVASPGIQQTFVHDLESFFWVLLWLVLRYVETSWKGSLLSSVYKSVFGQDLYDDPEGVFGGVHKKDFLQNREKLGEFQVIGNTILTNLLKDLKAMVSSRYRTKPEKSKYLPDADASYNMEVKFYNSQDDMNDHTKMLNLFAVFLDPSNVEDWPGDDKATPQPLQPSISEARNDKYRTKRARRRDDVGGESSSKTRRTAHSLS